LSSQQAKADRKFQFPSIDIRLCLQGSTEKKKCHDNGWEYYLDQMLIKKREAKAEDALKRVETDPFLSNENKKKLEGGEGGKKSSTFISITMDRRSRGKRQGKQTNKAKFPSRLGTQCVTPFPPRLFATKRLT
jgi:hypothetical protein